MNLLRMKYVLDVAKVGSLGKASKKLMIAAPNISHSVKELESDLDYRLGIIRYVEDYDVYFKIMLEEKGIQYELVTEYTFSLIMSKVSPLAKKEKAAYADLTEYI